MPVKLAGEDRKILIAGGGLFALLLALALAFSPETNQDLAIPSSYSVSSHGAKAAYLLLKETGRDVQRWEKPPLELRSGPQPTTYVLAEPISLPDTNERAAIYAFVRGGGRLLAIGATAATMLPENATEMSGIPDFQTWRKYRPLGPTELSVAREITMVAPTFWQANQKTYVPVYGDSDDRAVVIKYRYGKGEVIWWAGATPLTNAGIREPGNVELLLASVEGKQRRRILWDEYFHGRRAGGMASAVRVPLRWLLLQLALLATAVLLTFSRRSGPIRMPRTESRLSPLEFVDTLGGLYRRAQATQIPVEVAYQRFRFLLTRRLGMPANTPATDLEQAARERLGLSGDQLARTLRACEAARSQAALSTRDALAIVQSLNEISVALKLVRLSSEEPK